MKGKWIVLSALCALTTTCFLNSCEKNSNSNRLVVGMECDYAPFNWTALEKNDFTLPIDNVKNQYVDGYDVQIAKYLGEQLNMEVVIKKIDWDSLVFAVDTNMINCIIAGMSYSEERDLSVDFTSNYYTSQMTMIVRKTSSLVHATSIQDFNGYKVGSQRGTLTDDIIDQIQGVNHVTAYDSFAIAATAVSTNQIDAMTAEYPVAVSIVKADPSLSVVTFSKENGFTGLDENELGVAVAIKEGNTTLQTKIDHALSQLSEEKRKEMMDATIQRAPAAE